MPGAGAVIIKVAGGAGCPGVIHGLGDAGVEFWRPGVAIIVGLNGLRLLRASTWRKALGAGKPQ